MAMKKIDQETVRKILDAADIVEVVSDFVSLKRRGANYVGLCPFHNERTPSFSVSKARGFCHCFSCGKGGSPVGFLMELEQLSYVEALRYLARKYHIEIMETEMTAEEREAATERESMLSANEFAMEHFERNLTDTDDGRDIGLSYFRERGINDAAIKRFHLGYAIDRSDNLLAAARKAGFSDKILINTGLEIRTDDGRMYDRFKGRVIYPVIGLSGKVLAFGGRTLRKDKNVAKYVNSPESAVYSKSRELYGLYQARTAIAKKDKCILVEGYMDVISMHQSGVENVIASSGTSLTEGQIRLIRRFTTNITVIYDSDPAGIKASLRGIDMLLAEGMNIKVLLLPEGDDPDSYAQSHTAAELESYLQENEKDFISFKTSILMRDCGGDPIARSKVISDVVRSISVIPDMITRNVYIGECSRKFGIDEKVLTLQCDKLRAERAATPRQAREQADVEQPQPAGNTLQAVPPAAPAGQAHLSHASGERRAKMLHGFEREVVKMVVRYGMVDLCEAYDEEGNPSSMKLIDYIDSELSVDEIRFDNGACRAVWEEALALRHATWPQEYADFLEAATRRRSESVAAGEEQIRREAVDLADIKRRELMLLDSTEATYAREIEEFASMFLVRYLVNSPDDNIRHLATELASNRHELSKIHSKYTNLGTERDRLPEIVPQIVYALKSAILDYNITQIHGEIAARQDEPGFDPTPLIKRLIDLSAMRSELAHFLGDRIVAPPRKC